MNDINSRIIIDDTGLEQLKGNGQGIFKRKDITNIQCPFLSVDKAKKLLKPLYIKKEKISPTPQNESEVDFIC